jgi:two-component system chemotaxis response regulator CheB
MPHKVMIVEDSAMMRIVIANFLKASPEFDIVAVAENGRKALSLLPQHPDLSIILTDLEMPEMDGFEFLRQAKQQTKAKCIVLSSLCVAGSPHVAKVRDLGASAVVVKPSGSVSMDLAEKSGAELLKVMKTLAGK